MKKIAQEEFDSIMLSSDIKPRVRKELRFIKSIENITDEQWLDSEMIRISGRSDKSGVLLISFDQNLYVVSYDLKMGIVSSSTGRAQSIICDLCRTWQYGNKSAMIIFATGKKSSVSYLCCADLKCSLHIRNQTSEAKISRSQLREDLSVEQRVVRLRNRLKVLIEDLSLTPVINYQK